VFAQPINKLSVRHASDIFVNFISFLRLINCGLGSDPLFVRPAPTIGDPDGYPHYDKKEATDE